MTGECLVLRIIKIAICKINTFNELGLLFGLPFASQWKYPRWLVKFVCLIDVTCYLSIKERQLGKYCQQQSDTSAIPSALAPKFQSWLTFVGAKQSQNLLAIQSFERLISLDKRPGRRRRQSDVERWVCEQLLYVFGACVDRSIWRAHCLVRTQVTDIEQWSAAAVWQPF